MVSLTENGERIAGLTGDLLQDAYVAPSWDSFLEDLASQAVDEDWDWPLNPEGGGRRPVLSSLVRFTYRRVVGQDRVAWSKGDDGQMKLAWATGVYTDGLDLIYAIMEPNFNRGRQDWVVSRAVPSSRIGSTVFPGPLPDPATYWDNACQLLFDVERGELRYDAAQLAERPDLTARFPEVLRATTTIHRSTLLAGAIERMRRLAKLNPRIAAPSFAFSSDGGGDGRLSLMLPLQLVHEEGPDMALVVVEEELGDGEIIYRALTLLDIDHAYRNGRLLGRLDPVWFPE